MTGANRADVTAVVVTHESVQVLPACLRALAAAELPVVLIDNASTDRSGEVARELGARVLRNPCNEGYGRANNRGIRNAEDASWCLIVNPDVVIQPDCVDELLAAARRYPEAVLLGPRLVEHDHGINFRSRSLLSHPRTTPLTPDPEPSEDRPTEMLSGACLLVRRSVFLECGGFDESIFLYYEDDDLCYRLMRAGYGLMYVHNAIAHHARGGSSSERPGSLFQQRYHLAWSREFVFRKHGRRSGTAFILFRNTVKWLRAIAVSDSHRIERYGGSIAGAWAALRGREALSRDGC